MDYVFTFQVWFAFKIDEGKRASLQEDVRSLQKEIVFNLMKITTDNDNPI